VRKPSCVLDSFAVLAYLQAEPAGPKVKDLLIKAREKHALAFLSIINLGEIIYTVGRRLGDEAASGVQNNLVQRSICNGRFGPFQAVGH
jgi:hypothetical protein